jgi:hypothetical protein
MAFVGTGAAAISAAFEGRGVAALCGLGDERELTLQVCAVAGGAGGRFGGANQLFELMAAFVAIEAVDRHGLVQSVVQSPIDMLQNEAARKLRNEPHARL